MLIMHAACDVVERDEFDDILSNVRDRIDEIESLHRTRELTVGITLDPQDSANELGSSSKMYLRVVKST